MNETLHWRELQLGFSKIPAGSVQRGEYVRIIMDSQSQMDFMAHIFTCHDDKTCSPAAWNMFLETASASYAAGTPEFICRVGGLIRHRGLLANLSLRENLLLPFLYRVDHKALKNASVEVNDVADWLGIGAVLDEQAGERSSYTHALISLGRCMLSKPAMIVAQEVHIGMTPERLLHFRELAAQALQELGAGMIYLTATEHEGSGLVFSRTLTIDSEDEMLAFQNLDQNDLTDIDMPEIGSEGG